MNIEQGISNFEIHYSTFDILNSILSSTLANSILPLADLDCTDQ